VTDVIMHAICVHAAGAKSSSSSSCAAQPAAAGNAEEAMVLPSACKNSD